MGVHIKKKSRSDITSCIKRCSVEMLDLHQHYESKSIQINLLSTNEVHFIIEGFDGKVLKFILPERYPFHQPKLMINDNFYKNCILQNPTCERINTFLKKNRVDCMCCSSIICDKNWSPAYRIENVLFEIAQVRFIKNYIKHYLILDDICRKKNIDTDTIGNCILEFLLDNPFDGQLFCKVK
jgi:ubiquitin-protein ligase